MNLDTTQYSIWVTPISSQDDFHLERLNRIRWWSMASGPRDPMIGDRSIVGERDVRADALKGFLIVLVVFGHLIEPFVQQSQLAQYIWAAIYLFHIPLFVLLSGMYAKDVLVQRDYDLLVQRVLLPLVVFQVLYLTAIYIVKRELLAPVLQPHWILWFLLNRAGNLGDSLV